MRGSMAGLKQKEINNLGKWYQTIDFGKYGKSKGSAKDLDKKWELVKKELPFSLRGKSVLDLGCNAGYFMLQAMQGGSRKVWGIEVVERFYKQSLFTMRSFSLLNPSIDLLRRKGRIKLINSDAKDTIFSNIFDITFAFNFFYWLTYSDEEGSIENPEDTFLKFLKKLSFHTKYLLVIGADGVAKDRKRKGLNSLGTSLERTLPFLQPYFDICKHRTINSGRKKASNIILCKTKEH